jgi:hypothetical protein
MPFKGAWQLLLAVGFEVREEALEFAQGNDLGKLKLGLKAVQELVVEMGGQVN